MKDDIKIIFDDRIDENSRNIYMPIIINNIKNFINEYNIDYDFVRWINIHFNKNNKLEDYDGLFVHKSKIVNIYGVSDLLYLNEVLFHEFHHAKFEKEIESKNDYKYLEKYYKDDYAIIFENEYKAYYYTYEYYLRTLGIVGGYYSKLINYLKESENGLNNKEYSAIKRINLLARKVAIIKIFTEYKDYYKKILGDKEYYQKYLEKCEDLQEILLLSTLATSKHEDVYIELYSKILYKIKN